MSLRTKLDRLLSSDFENPFMSHQYVIETVSIPGFVAKGNVTDFSQILSNKFFRERTESVELPFKTFAVEDRHVMATKKYYAGYASFNSFNATFFEDDKCSAMRGFVTWQKLMVNDDADYSPAAEYQAKMVLRLLNCADVGIAKVTFEGVWPSQITTVSLTGSEVTRVAIQVSFSVNKVTWE